MDPLQSFYISDHAPGHSEPVDFEIPHEFCVEFVSPDDTPKTSSPKNKPNWSQKWAQKRMGKTPRAPNKKNII